MADTVLVTGANGFVAGAVLSRLQTADLSGQRPHVRGAVRRDSAMLPRDVTPIVVGDIDAKTDWQRALHDVERVVHTAARVHVMRDTDADVAGAYRRVNVDGTMRLAMQAATAGVRRFVYLSSVKVLGERTERGVPFTEESEPIGASFNADPYGRSKLEAEVALRELSRTSGMEVVIVRPPLVYGPGVRANFQALVGAVRRGIPLPFGMIENRRSLVSSANLADFLVCALSHTGAGGQTFLVSDGEDLSTPDLVRRMARAMGRAPRLLSVPPALLLGAASLLGRAGAASRLIESLQVDAAKAHRVMQWIAPHTVDDELRRTVIASVRGAR